MLRSITAAQLIEWMQYDIIEPFGEWRDDWRSAEIVTMLANVNRDSKKRKDPYKVIDFLPKFGEQEQSKPKHQTVKQQVAIAKLIAAAFNSTTPKKKKR